jgi:hypothetical protein
VSRRTAVREGGRRGVRRVEDGLREPEQQGSPWLAALDDAEDEVDVHRDAGTAQRLEQHDGGGLSAGGIRARQSAEEVDRRCVMLEVADTSRPVTIE